MVTRRSLLFAVLACRIAGTTMPAAAEEYPSRNVTIVVPYPAGGPTDETARVIAQSMAARLKQSFIVDDISGGNKDRHVRLSVDRAMPYGDFYQLIETVRQAGYLKFNLLGLERREAQ